MNLTEALDAVLPELPQARISRSNPPRLDPDLIVHETVLDGEPVIGVLKRGKNSYFRLSPTQWQILQLFDGNRSYQEIADQFTRDSGAELGVQDVRVFADEMEGSDLWYQSYQDKNLAMREKLLAQRDRRAKAKLNMAHISFSAWDPDQYLTWLDGVAGKVIYGRWALLAALILFAVETVMVVQNWHMIGPDTALFFNFAQKSFGDFARFWVLILIVGFVHESAHGLTCKHYGGQVHSMGLMLLYLTPCFFVDVTESWVSGTKVQRLATIIAGIWIELVLCGIAMIFWLNASSGTWFHKFMYEFILMTGIAAVVINLNPLLKLDGYYFLTELIEIPELKERSSAFLTAWVKAKVLRMPVDIPIVPRRRVTLFVIYAILSGAYSYLLLFIVIRFSYRLGSKWFGDFAILPSMALALFIFRSRLAALGRTVKDSWTRVVTPGFRWRPIHAFIATGVCALLFVPLWRDREHAYFVIEASESRTICAAVPGQVESVLVQEGQKVRSGDPLLRMSSNQAASMRSDALARSGLARFRAFDAQLQGRSIGSAAADQAAALQMAGLAGEAQAALVLTAPADGTVLTDDPARLVYQKVASGQPLLVIAEGARIARVFIPASALDRITPGAEVALALPGRFSPLRLTLNSIAGEPVGLPSGLVAKEKYKGLTLPIFYNSVVPLPPNSTAPAYGLSGPAIVFGARRSIADRLAASLSNAVRAHLWW
jgi:putative peptide zinc metalloprotease protein